MYDRKVEFRECFESKLVRAEENSPRREPWGSREIAKPRHGAKDRGGAVFRPLPGLFQARLIPTARAMGYFLAPLRAGEASLRTRYARIPASSFGIRNPATSKSRTPLVREWDYDPRENGQVALGRPILQDARARCTGM